MEESNKKKAQLLKELADARKRISELEKSETVRKIAEEALHETERLYREIYTIAPLAFVIWDMNCRITDWNKRAEEVFGWTREEVLGRNFFEFLIPERAQIRVETAVEALLQKELPNRQISNNLRRGLGGQWFGDFLGHIDVELLENLDAQTSVARVPQLTHQLLSPTMFLAG